MLTVCPYASGTGTAGVRALGRGPYDRPRGQHRPSLPAAANESRRLPSQENARLRVPAAPAMAPGHIRTRRRHAEDVFTPPPI